MPKIDRNALEQDLKSIIAEVIESDASNITPEANFVEDLGMDSMMALEILAALEKKYKLHIPEEHLTKMVNLKQTIELLLNFMKT